MTKMEYAQKVAELVGGVVKEYEKNNGVVRIGVTVDGNAGEIAPVMYVDDFYDNGEDAEKMAKELRDAVEMTKKKMGEFGMEMKIDNFEKVKDRLFVKLVNEKNASEEFVYKSAKKYGYDDLILMPVIIMDTPAGKGSAKVKMHLVDKWNVTVDEVIETALNNVDFVVEPLAKRLSAITGEPEEFFGKSPLTIVSTGDGLYGAVAIIKAEEELKKAFPNGYIVIPSSIHEMLVLPYDNVEEDNINDLIVDINEHVVLPEECLSNNAYKFV